MKTAEDFRRDFGETEESFRTRVRQTLTLLECKEEEPVKKKINLGLVLAIVVVLLTVTAVAEEQWGILSFLRNQGKTVQEDQLLSLQGISQPDASDEHDLVNAIMTEALYEDGTLYLAVTLSPLKENTMVVPAPDTNHDRKHRVMEEPNRISMSQLSLSGISMQEAMQNAAYGDVSVLDYAREHGFAHVVVMDNYAVGMHSTQAFWSKDQYDGVEYVEYTLAEDGSLQIILQTSYQPNLVFADTRMESATVDMRLWAFDTAAPETWLYGNYAAAHAYFAIPVDRLHLCSIPEDAHDIVGYIGSVEFISIAPYDEEYMAITIQLNMGDRRTEKTWMTGPAWGIMDAEGNRLCTVDETKYIAYSTVADANGDTHSVTHGLFPAEYMPEGNQITLQAENRNNHNIVYDEYTYTLVSNQATE